MASHDGDQGAQPSAEEKGVGSVGDTAHSPVATAAHTEIELAGSEAKKAHNLGLLAFAGGALGALEVAHHRDEVVQPLEIWSTVNVRVIAEQFAYQFFSPVRLRDKRHADLRLRRACCW